LKVTESVEPVPLPDPPQLYPPVPVPPDAVNVIDWPVIMVCEVGEIETVDCVPFPTLMGAQ
jgi:hypothetical protein